MRGGRRRGEARAPVEIWPGFVDALSTLLLAVIFMLAVFVLGQFFLGEVLRTRDRALLEAEAAAADLAARLEAERAAAAGLREELGQTSADLGLALRDRDALGDAGAGARARASGLEAELAAARAEAAGLARARDAEAAAARAAAGELAALGRRFEAVAAELGGLEATVREREAEVGRQAAVVAGLGARLDAALAGDAQGLAGRRAALFRELGRALDTRPGGVRVAGDRLVLGASLLFAAGAAVVRPEGEAELARLAAALRDATRDLPADLPWLLQVDAHGDGGPVATDGLPSGWELAAARASAVARSLAAGGVPADRVAARGLAPVDPGEGEAAGRRDGRVEIGLAAR